MTDNKYPTAPMEGQAGQPPLQYPQQGYGGFQQQPSDIPPPSYDVAHGPSPQPQGQQPYGPPQGYGAPLGPGYGPPQGFNPQQGYGAMQGYGAPQGFGAPIITQPQSQIQWMPMPATRVPNCPPGLEYLSTIDQLLVKQEMEIMELITGYETSNKYRVLNNMSQSLYYAVEESESCARNCMGALRMFDIKVFDNTGNEVIHIFRPFRYAGCCYPMCLQELEVSSPVGDVVGYVTQLWSMSKQYFQIENANREPILKIVGPYCTFSCGQDVVFQVLSLDEKNEVGTIRKQWSGLLRENFTDTDNFGITFPVDLDVRMKAVMLGAAFLIDFMFYETSQQRRRHHGHGPGLRY